MMTLLQCCQPWDFISRSWNFLRLLDFLGILFSGIRPWDFSWDFSNQRVIEKKPLLTEKW